MAKDYIEEVRKVVISRGGECLSDECVGKRSKIIVRCKCGKKWQTTVYRIIDEKTWCRKCSSQKYCIEDIKKIAKSRGGQCVSSTYNGYNGLVDFICQHGHEWKTSPKNIIFANTWCPKCRYIKARNTIEQAQQIAISNNGICLSKRYTIGKLEWKCNRGHVWPAPYSRIKNGKWCPECNLERQRNGLSSAHKLANNMGGLCLNKYYKNANTKMKWKCCNGHIWFAVYSSIRRGSWCAICKKSSQRRLFNIIKEIFNKEVVLFDYNEFDWLKNNKTGGIQEIDIWVPHIKLAIEYDGEQHFNPIKYFGGEEKFIKTKTLDALKNYKIAQNKKDVKYFIRFNYKDTLTKNNVLSILKDNGVFDGYQES